MVQWRVRLACPMCRLCSMVGRGNDVRISFEIFNGTVTRSTTSRVRSTTSRVRLACSMCRLCSIVGRGNNLRSSFEIFNGTVTRSTASRVRSTTSRVRLACSMCRLCSMVGQFGRSVRSRWRCNSFDRRSPYFADRSIAKKCYRLEYPDTFFGRTLFLIVGPYTFFGRDKK